MIGDHEDAVAVHRHAAVDSRGGVAGEALRPRPLIVPDAPPRPRVQRVALVGVGDVHHPVDHDRRHLQARGAGQREHPRRREARDRAAIDLVGRAVAIAAAIAVVGRPVGLRRDASPRVAGPAQQVQCAAIGEELRVGGRAIEGNAVHGAAVGHRDAQARRRVAAPGSKGPREADERPQVGVRDGLSGHALRWQAVAHEGGQFIVRPQGESRHDPGAHLAAARVGAVAAGA